MQMKHGLAGAAPGVHNRAISPEQIAFASQLRGDHLNLAKHRLVSRRCLVQRFEMSARANENVRGRLRVNVLKRENIGVLVHQFRRNLLAADFAEEAIRAHRFAPPGGVSSCSRKTSGLKPSRLRSFSAICRAASSPAILPTRTR